jgi:drug/metabolite transporter (DMT)-like permease
MRETADNPGGSLAGAADSTALDARLRRDMVIAVALAASASVLLGSWRVTTGLLLGGALSVLNYYWLRSSIAAAFGLALSGKNLRMRSSRYILRYFVIGALVYSAYRLNAVSLPATIVGLSSFVAALFTEALREFYLGTMHREGID